MPVGRGYCGVDSAELAPVRTGDLGRCETGTVIGRGTAGSSPLRTYLAGVELGLRRPLSVLTSRTSIDGLLW